MREPVKDYAERCLAVMRYRAGETNENPFKVGDTVRIEHEAGYWSNRGPVLLSGPVTEIVGDDVRFLVAIADEVTLRGSSASARDARLSLMPYRIIY